MPTECARGPYQNGVARRLKIINAATSVFANHGYVGGSLRRIAEHAELTEPGVLRHFGSKSALLLATLAHWAPALELVDTRRPTTGLAQLHVLREHVAAHRTPKEPRQLFTIITAEASNEGHPAREFVLERRTRQLSQLSRLVIEASDAGEISPLRRADAEAEARLILALLEGLELQWLMEPATDVPALVETYLHAAVERWEPSAEGPAVASRE